MPFGLEGSGTLGNGTMTHPLCPWSGGAPEKGLDTFSPGSAGCAESGSDASVSHPNQQASK